MSTAYDLFCGAGGASLGLVGAGYEVHGFEMWDVAVKTHRDQVGPCEQVDLNTHDWSSWATPDLLWASPPCQPFSAAGKGLAHADPRDCMPAFLRAVRELMPPVVIMENVRGLTYKKNRPYLESVADTLRDLGYQVEWRVLNCADYGIAQTRQRLFMVACLNQAPNWPLPTHAKDGTDGLLPWVTMAAALGWGMSERPAFTVTHGSPQGGADGFGGSGARAGLVREQEAGRWVLNPGRTASQPNRRSYSTDEPAPTVAFGHDAANWCWERPSTTVACDPRVSFPGHHDENARSMSAEHGAIRLTVEQAAALQGFPASLEFGGSRTQQFHQVGNAVPPPIAYLLAKANEPDGGPTDEDVRDMPEEPGPVAGPTEEGPGGPVGGVQQVQGPSAEAEVGRPVQPETAGLVMAATYWSTNAALVADCVQLGYLRQTDRVLDPTYGRGLWWTDWTPDELVAPSREEGWDFTDMRWMPRDEDGARIADGSFDAVAYDPPYVAKGGRSTSGIQEMDDRYGMEDAPATPALLQALINAGLVECARVVKPRGYILVKCKDYISSGKMWPGTLKTSNVGLMLGLELVDRLEHLSRTGGPQPAGRRQVHARRNLSTLLVFRKGRS